MCKTLNVFTKPHEYCSLTSLKREIDDMKKLKILINTPFILDRLNLSSPISFPSITEDKSLFTLLSSPLYPIFLDWICVTLKENAPFNPNEPYDYLISVSDEDRNWSKIGNKGLKKAFYKKLCFKQGPAEKLLTALDKDISNMINLCKSWEKEITYNTKKNAALNKKWHLLKMIKESLPSGGEISGKDGFVEAIYEDEFKTCQIRMISRNVFDVGIFSYPERLKDSSWTNQKNWSSQELSLNDWICKFGPFAADPALRM